MITMELYIFLTIVGITLTLAKDILDVDIFGGYNFSTILSASLLMWGILGLFGVDEPWAFIIGVFFFGLLTHVFISAVVTQTDIVKEYTGKYGKVNMEIDPDSRGKIKVETDKTIEFFIATNAEPINKPLKVGTPVQIVEFDGIVAKVRAIDRPRDNKSQNRSIGFFESIVLFIKNLRNRGLNTCSICFGKIEKSYLVKSCPHCERTFHSTHWKQWLETNSYCPVCREDVR